jgi:two-component system chemotaxis response regulator CheY
MIRRGLRILIVEDSTAMRQLLALAVRKYGAEAVEAPDGLAALKLLSHERFDLVFVDLNMPILDGMKLIQKVRANEALASTCVCVVTTESAKATEEHARALGANYFLRKPVARRDVERVLAEAFPADPA